MTFRGTSRLLWMRSLDALSIDALLLFLPGKLRAHLGQRREDEIEDKYTNANNKKNLIVVHFYR
ncbi:MAG TPA: hypothetical protein V6D35_00725 [Candidatus Sericytochromatia bacterium]